jgi:hypothetical protein
LNKAIHSIGEKFVGKPGHTNDPDFGELHYEVTTWNTFKHSDNEAQARLYCNMALQDGSQSSTFPGYVGFGALIGIFNEEFSNALLKVIMNKFKGKIHELRTRASLNKAGKINESTNDLWKAETYARKEAREAKKRRTDNATPTQATPFDAQPQARILHALFKSKVEEAEARVQRAIEEEERAKSSSAKSKAKTALNLAKEVLKQAI